MLQKVRDFERRYKGGWVAIKSGGVGGGVYTRDGDHTFCTICDVNKN